MSPPSVASRTRLAGASAPTFVEAAGPNVAWVISPIGVLRTTDGGTAWTPLALPANAGVLWPTGSATAGSPASVSALAVGLEQADGSVDVASTGDGGATWSSAALPTVFSEGHGSFGL